MRSSTTPLDSDASVAQDAGGQHGLAQRLSPMARR